MRTFASLWPYVRKMYLIHYCISGSGVLIDKFGEHKIKTGELFIIRPDEITTYIADSCEPWHYVWIGFSGAKAEMFLNKKSVYACNERIFLKMKKLVEQEELSSDIYTAFIYEIIYELFSKQTVPQDVVFKVCRYIEYNYMQNITAESVSRLFGYERTYLYRIFKKRHNMGVKEYIIKVRLEHAREFLLEGNAVCKVAAMTGYCDEFNFSKAYKKYYGVAPSKEKR